MALLDKVSERKGVLVCISRRKSLVRHIKECIVSSRLDSLADLLPLLRSWVDTSWVVSASVKQESASLRCSLDIRNHSLKVKTNCILVVVSVFLNLQT